MGPIGQIWALLALGHFRDVDMGGKGLVEESFITHRFDRLFEARGAEGGDVLRSRPLLGVLDQAFLEDDRMRRVDDREARQTWIVSQRRAPGDGSAPVVAYEGET